MLCNNPGNSTEIANKSYVDSVSNGKVSTGTPLDQILSPTDTLTMAGY